MRVEKLVDGSLIERFPSKVLGNPSPPRDGLLIESAGTR
ncbi:hypothetical protein RISK_003393 [Rhodopirellula islandica]|uniref:Uncharacterized protein n=1 Tax=Rhodopirellula islandica TaxID=595434 RepID=A0A0J1EFP9_RHOIS|nr:hypothetical protein RISK_003393 [Rhodopirellula islandica]